MGRIDEAKRIERLRAIGMKGKLPAVLTEKVIEAVRTHPQGEVYSIADGRVPGLVLEVGTGGTATWWLRYRQAGAQRRLKIGAVGAVMLKDARALAQGVLADVARGEDPAQARKEARSASQTVREYLDLTYEPRVLQHAKGGADTKARILFSWEPLLTSPIAQLTRDAIEKVLADRKAAEKPDGSRKTKNGTLLRDWSSFRAMLADAVDRGALAAIPMARRPEPIRKLRGNQRVRYLGQKDDENTKPGEGEAERFEKALAAFQSAEPGGGDFLRFVAGMALATGMRRGEIIRLSDKILNIRERRIDLTPEITKSNKARTVYLSDAALAALKLWNVRGKGGKLFSGEGNPDDVAAYWENRATRDEWPRLCAAAQLEDFHLHDCRHDYAVRLLRSGATLPQVRDALGHASVTQTEKYAHVVESDVRNAVLALGRSTPTVVK